VLLLADLVVLGIVPLQDICHLRQVEIIVQEGKIIMATILFLLVFTCFKRKSEQGINLLTRGYD